MLRENKLDLEAKAINERLFKSKDIDSEYIENLILTVDTDQNKIITGSRRSGRTTLLVKSAIIAALKNKKVLYVVQNKIELDLIKSYITNYSNNLLCTNVSTDSRISFINSTGTIDIVISSSNENIFRGRYYNNIIIDNVLNYNISHGLLFQNPVILRTDTPILSQNYYKFNLTPALVDYD